MLSLNLFFFFLPQQTQIVTPNKRSITPAPTTEPITTAALVSLDLLLLDVEFELLSLFDIGGGGEFVVVLDFPVGGDGVGEDSDESVGEFDSDGGGGDGVPDVGVVVVGGGGGGDTTDVGGVLVLEGDGGEVDGFVGDGEEIGGDGGVVASGGGGELAGGGVVAGGGTDAESVGDGVALAAGVLTSGEGVVAFCAFEGDVAISRFARVELRKRELHPLCD